MLHSENILFLDNLSYNFIVKKIFFFTFLDGSVCKNLPTMQETQEMQV